MEKILQLEQILKDLPKTTLDKIKTRKETRKIIQLIQELKNEKNENNTK